MAKAPPPPPPKNEPLSVETFSIDPRELKLLDKNARHMSAKQFTQLVANVQRDGALTSAPLVWRDDTTGKLVVLSGNHRTKAAVAAGLSTISVLEVKGDLSAARRTAIQLSHNAITGDDDANILRELYESLDVLEQRYSGLTDTDFGLLDDLQLSKLSLGQPNYQTVSLLFLPEDREVFVDVMQKLGKAAAKQTRYVARLGDFERFEQALVTVQDTLDVRNQALAVLAMAELALEHLNNMGTANGVEESNGSEQSSAAESERGETPASVDPEADDQGGGSRPKGKRRNPVRSSAKAQGQPVVD